MNIVPLKLIGCTIFVMMMNIAISAEYKERAAYYTWMAVKDECYEEREYWWKETKREKEARETYMDAYVALLETGRSPREEARDLEESPREEARRAIRVALLETGRSIREEARRSIREEARDLRDSLEESIREEARRAIREEAWRSGYEAMRVGYRERARINLATINAMANGSGPLESVGSRITNQGNVGVCTCYAIASAITDQVKWRKDVDLDEESIVAGLMKIYKHSNGIDPIAFNGSKFAASTADDKKWWYALDIQIHHTTKIHREFARKFNEISGQDTYWSHLCRSTCVISYQTKTVHKGNYKGYHCVYLRSFDSKSNAWIGQNSWGVCHVNDQYPKISYALENVSIYDVVVRDVKKV